MTRYLEGVLVCVALLAPLAAGAVGARRRALPAWEGAPARLAEAVLGLGVLILIAFTMLWFTPYDHWLTITIIATMQPYFGNTFARASSHGLQIRSGGKVWWIGT